MRSFIFSSDPRRFSFILLAVFGLIAGTVLLGRQAFRQVGDLLPEAEVVALQQAYEGTCLYHSAALDNHPAYKAALYTARKTPVVALGSSRVLQINEKMFRAPFTNLGRTLVHFNDLFVWLRRLEAMGPPKIVLLGVDFWWFNPAISPGRGKAGQLVSAVPFKLGYLRTLASELVRYPQLLAGLPAALLEPPACPLGIMARQFRDGFGPDGFRYRGFSLTATRPYQASDYRFSASLPLIRKSKKSFRHGQDYDAGRVRRFISAIKAAERRGMTIIMFFPPLAPTITRAMADSHGYAYIGKAVAALKRAGLKIHDFRNPDRVNASDCEFYDGFHQGDAVQARIIAQIARREPLLKKVLDERETGRVAAITGLAGIYQRDVFGDRETDFLGLGCKKPSGGG
ncbi:MAG TPA: hypothetical protein ENK41_05505 [Rhodobacteraceae bacterium]|nr:hypothetical protein [Paracoccaceae bacterium]